MIRIVVIFSFFFESVDGMGVRRDFIDENVEWPSVNDGSNCEFGV